MEEWKDIYYYDYEKDEWIDYTGIYQISNKGHVKRFYKNGNKKLLKENIGTNGYLKVDLSKEGNVKTFNVHRLVALIFIENNEPLVKTQVNHIDENKENNSVENLEWCTKEYNLNYGTRTERAGKNHRGKNHSSSKAIICVTTGEIYESIREAERKTGIAHQHISKCCKGKYKFAGKTENGEKLVWKFLRGDDLNECL